MNRTRATAPGESRPLQSGQAEVETAIVLPLVVFMLLGLLQLGLLNQAWVITKYAAYRAVRTGALRNLDTKAMEAVAVAVALPLLSDPGGGMHGLSKSYDSDTWALKYKHAAFRTNQMTGLELKFASVEIKAPTRCELPLLEGEANDVFGEKFVPFDLVTTGGRGILTKLRIELTINLPMIIPFANMVIFSFWRGANALPFVNRKPTAPVADAAVDGYDRARQAGVYVLPIRAQYAMKMHSDFPLSALPAGTNCNP